MVAEYFFSLSLDFPTYFNQSQLVSEIIGSSISTPFVAILVDGDGVDIIFDSTLSVPDEATLNSVVASHAPIPDAPSPDQTAPPIQPDAVVPPSINNDSGSGFSVGSVWVDTITKVAYVCTDATTGAAVWKPVTTSMTNVGTGNGQSYKDTTSSGVFEMKTVLAGTGVNVVDNTNEVSVNLDIPALTPTILLDVDGDYIPIYSVGATAQRKIHPVDLFANIPKSNSSAVTAPTVTDDIDAGYSNGSVWVDTVTGIAYTLVDSTSGAAVWKIATIELGSSAPEDVTKAAASVGTSQFAARADHKHNVATAAAVTIGTANSEGTSTSLARADHVHDHGAQTNQLHHALASGSLHGFMSSTDKTKLDSFNVVVNRLWVQQNPGTGEFSSINAALASITTNSVSNPFLICVGPGVFNEAPIVMKQYVYIQGCGDQVTNIVCSTPTGKCISGIDNSGILDCNLSGATGTGGIAVYFESFVGSFNPFLVRDCVFGSNETLVKAYGSVAPTILQIDGVRFGGATDTFTNGFICECAPGVPTGLSINNISYMDIIPPTSTVFSRTSGNMTSTVFTNSTIRIVPTVGTTAFYVEDGGDIRMSSSYVRGFDIGLHAGNVGAASNIIAQSVVFVETISKQIFIEHPGTTGHFFGSYLYEQIDIPQAAPFYIDHHDHNTIVVAKKGGDFESIAAAVDSIADSSVTNVYTIDVHSGVYTEPLIDLTTKPYINIRGPTIQGATVVPDGNHDVFHVSVSNEISFLTIRDVPAGYAGIVTDDGGDYGQAHKVSFYDVDIGIKVISSTQDTVFYGEYIDFNGNYTYAVYIEANNGFRAFANLENYYNFPYSSADPTGVYITGPGASAIILAAGHYGNDLGRAIYVQDGGSVSTVATEIIKWDTGVHVGNVGDPSTVKISAVFSDNITNDVNIEHPMAIGSISGSLERSKLASASTSVSQTFNDPVDVGFVSVGKLFLGPTPDTLVSSLDILQQAPCMGVYNGGVLSDGGGLDVQVAAGYGYHSPIAAYLQRKDWTTTTLTLPADSSVYVYFNSSGVLTSNVTYPDTRTTILLGKVTTDSSNILYIQNIKLEAHHYCNMADRLFREGFGVVYINGSIVTESGTRNLDVSNGEYYYSQTEFAPSGGTGISWDAYYRSASPGVYTRIAGQTTVSNTQYDDNSGTLASIAASQYAKHVMYVIGDGADEKYVLVYSQDTYPTQGAAEAAALPTPPSFVSDAFARLSGIIVQEGVSNIVVFTDERPFPSYKSSAVSGGVTDHGALSGLGDDDHTQYILVNGSRAFSGNQSMGGFNLTSVGTVNGVTVETHGSRHLPNGADPITTAAPSSALSATTSNAVGIANSLARSDHSHAISTGVVSTQTPNQTNAAGTSASLARADHVHNIPTATAVNIGVANSAGSASSFAASDHVHQGIHALSVNSGTLRYGDINLANGTGVTITDGGAGTFTVSASGEANTASNVGTGADIFKQKTGVDLEFRGVNGPGVIAAAVNADNIDLTVNSSTLSNQVLLSSGTVAIEPSWGAVPLGDANAVTGILTVTNGGTGASTLTSGNVLVGAGTSAVTTTKAAPIGAFVGTTDTQTLTNKSLVDASVLFVDDVDSTKKMQFQVSGVTTGTTRTLTVPNSSGTIALLGNNLGDFASTTSSQLAGVISDETGSGSLVFSTSPTLVTPSISSIVNTGTLTLPTSTDTLVGLSTTDTLNNKVLIDTTTTIANTADNTKRFRFAASGITTGTTKVLTVQNLDGTIALTQNNLGVFASTTSAQLAGVISDETGSGSLVFSTSPTLVTPSISSIVNTGTLALPTTSDTLIGRSTTDSLTNKSLIDTTVFYDNLDTTKQMQMQLSGITTATSRTLTVPDASGTLVLTDNAQTLTNKTMTGATNVLTASLLKSATTEIDVSSATAPTSGQVLTATGGSAATWQTPTAAVTSVVGTANQITVTGTTTPTLSISTGYAGQTSIITVGTIGTGTWNATTIAATVGGTGQTSYTTGDLLYASSSSTLSKLADVATGNALISGGVGVAPSWGKIGLGTHVSGTLPVANGGTGVTSSTGTVSIVLSNSPTLITPSISSIVNTGTLTLPITSDTLVGRTTADSLTNKSLIDTTVFYDNLDTTKQLQFQISGVTTATTRTLTIPDASGTIVLTDAAQTLTNKDMTSSLNNVTASGLFSGGGSGTVSVVAATAPTTGQVLTATGATTATWQTPVSGGGTVTNVSGTSGRITVIDGTTTPVVDIDTNYVGQSSITTVGTITTGTWNGSTIVASNGGTGLTSYTVGDLIYASGVSTLSKLADVSIGSYLRSGGVGNAPVWSTLKLPNSATTGDLLYASATDTVSNLADVATGNALISGGVGVAPLWGKIGLGTHVSGTLPVANGGTGVTASTGTVSVVLSNSPTLITPSISSIVNTGTLTLPTSSDTLVGQSTADSLTNKSLIDTTVFYDDGDTTKQMQFQLSGVTTSTTRTMTVPDASGTLVLTDNLQTLTNKTLTLPVISSIVNTGTLTLPTSSDTLVGRSTADSLTNKSLIDTTVFYDDADTTKQMQFQLSGVTTATTRTLTIPDASGTIVLTDAAQTLTNKVMTSSLNNVTASGLFTDGGSGTVSVVAATAPTTGQVLTATGATTATWQTPVSGGGTVTNVSGTSGRITVVNGTTTPVIDIDTGYIGQSSITTVGTITTGTWNGGVVGAAYGGTGQSTYTIGDLLYASGTTALSKLADVATGNALISGGVGVAPLWGKIGLGTHVSDTLPVANGGTGVTTSTGTVSVVLSNSPTLVTPSISSIVNTGTLTLPTSSDTLVGRATTDSLTNKSLIDTTVFYDDAVTTKQMQFQLSGITAATTRTLTVPDASGTLVLTGNAQSLTNKSLIDTTVFYDDADTTKQMQFQLSGITTATTRTMTVPNASGTLVLTDNAQTLTNKVMTSSLNNVTASGLFSGGGAGTVSVIAATAPTSGQILMATSATTATWQNGAAGTGTVTSVSAGTGLTLTGTASLAPTLSLTTPVSIANGGTGNTTGQPTITNSEVGTQTLQAVTSATYVDATGITLTPGAGTYFVIVSGWGSMSTGSATGRVSINVNGSTVTNSERRTSSASTNSFATQCIATVAGGQIIKVQYLTSSGTYNVGGCTLTLIRLS